MELDEKIRERCVNSPVWFNWHRNMSEPGITTELQLELTKRLALHLHDQLLLSSDRARRRGDAYNDLACKLLDLQTRIAALAGFCEQ